MQSNFPNDENHWSLAVLREVLLVLARGIRRRRFERRRTQFSLEGEQHATTTDDSTTRRHLHELPQLFEKQKMDSFFMGFRVVDLVSSNLNDDVVANDDEDDLIKGFHASYEHSIRKCDATTSSGSARSRSRARGEHGEKDDVALDRARKTNESTTKVEVTAAARGQHDHRGEESDNGKIKNTKENNSARPNTAALDTRTASKDEASLLAPPSAPAPLTRESQILFTKERIAAEKALLALRHYADNETHFFLSQAAIASSMEILSTSAKVMLPCVHKLWQALLPCFANKRAFVFCAACNLLRVVLQRSGSFLESRICQKLWPDLYRWLWILKYPYVLRSDTGRARRNEVRTASSSSRRSKPSKRAAGWTNTTPPEAEDKEQRERQRPTLLQDEQDDSIRTRNQSKTSSTSGTRKNDSGRKEQQISSRSSELLTHIVSGNATAAFLDQWRMAESPHTGPLIEEVEKETVPSKEPKIRKCEKHRLHVIGPSAVLNAPTGSTDEEIRVQSGVLDEGGCEQEDIIDSSCWSDEPPPMISACDLDIRSSMDLNAHQSCLQLLLAMARLYREGIRQSCCRFFNPDQLLVVARLYASVQEFELLGKQIETLLEDAERVKASCATKD
ncbi:unnamed protein product [Amoebophrya sp. A25]|nr:unnamed protein product [Amoebophrya sp. A25]|eukprot:GSA25T00016514001.1